MSGSNLFSPSFERSDVSAGCLVPCKLVWSSMQCGEVMENITEARWFLLPKARTRHLGRKWENSISRVVEQLKNSVGHDMSNVSLLGPNTNTLCFTKDTPRSAWIPGYIECCLGEGALHRVRDNKWCMGFHAHVEIQDQGEEGSPLLDGERVDAKMLKMLQVWWVVLCNL